MSHPMGSVCPDCKSFVRARFDRCPSCGRAADRHHPRQTAIVWRLGPVVILICVGLAVIGLVLSNEAPIPVRVGTVGTIADGAWLAVDDASWGTLLDAQNSGSRELLSDLAGHDRAFYEPAGVVIRVIAVGMGRVRVRVTKGVHHGATGWTQVENIRPREP